MKKGMRASEGEEEGKLKKKERWEWGARSKKRRSREGNRELRGIKRGKGR